MNDTQWKEFVIGDTFELINSSSYHKSDVIESDEKNKLPYVTRTSLNNGIEMHVKSDNSFNINSGNQIVFGAENADFFYQEHPFITGNKMYLLQHEKMSKLNGLFLVNALRNAIKGSGFGYSLGMTATRLSNRKVLLPATKNGIPNWEYMNELGKKLYFESYEFISEYIFKKYTQLSKELIGKDIPMLNDKEWLPFRIEEIFTKIQRGKRLTKANQISGDRPYISSTALNNGVDSFIDNKKDIRISEKDITIANSGSVGNSFYHPYEYVASDHVHSIGNNKYNKYQYLFIVTLLNRLQDKYHFNYEINDRRLKSDKLMLPVTNKNELDLEFMENYMKKIEYERLTKLIEYFNLK